MTTNTTPEYDAFAALLKVRHSIRRFKPEPLDDDTVRRLVDAARFAPSAGNAQPWDLIVVRDQAVKEKFAEIYLEQLRQKNRLEMTRPPEWRFFGDSAPEPKAGFVDAGALIVVVGDPRVTASYPLRTMVDKGPQHVVSSLATIVISLHYAAAALGLGSQYLSDTGSPEMAIGLRDLLGIPEPLFPYETVCVGHADTKPSGRFVKEVDDIVHFDAYDMTRFPTQEQVDGHILSKLRPGTKKLL